MAIFNSAQNSVFSFFLLSPVFHSFCLFLLYSVVRNEPRSSQYEDSTLCSCHLQHNDPLSPSLPLPPNPLSLSFFLLREQHHVVLAEKKTQFCGECQICCLAFLCVLRYSHISAGFISYQFVLRKLKEKVKDTHSITCITCHLHVIKCQNVCVR